jgi:hypothetical protein
LNEKRLIETIDLANLSDPLIRGIFAGERQRDISRHELQQPEDHECSKHDNGNDLQETTPDKPPARTRQHCRTSDF